MTSVETKDKQAADRRIAPDGARTRRPLKYEDRSGWGKLLYHVKRDRAYLLMTAIPVLYFLIFRYFPMLGLNIAFRDYSIGDGILDFPKNFVGLQWFFEFFSSPFAFRVIRNTIVLSLGTMLFTFPMPIILALAFNEIRNTHLRGFTQTVSYLPYFLSTAIVVSMMVNMFSINGGIANNILGLVGIEPVGFMQSNAWFRQMYIGAALWVSVGFSSILYTAAIAGVDPCLYEAAFVDGSSRLKNIFYITLPCIAPTIIIMLILRLGQVMSVGYEKILLMYNPQNMEVADVISTYVYRNGVTQGRFGYSASVDLFNSIINVCLLWLANTVSRKKTGTSIF